MNETKNEGGAERYVVQNRSRARYFAYLEILISLVLIAALIYLNVTPGKKDPPGTVLFECGACCVLLLLGVLALYCDRRPRIEVCGGRLICCPRWKGNRTVGLEEITDRKIVYRNAPPSSYGLLGYAANRGRSTRYLEIDYYAGGELLITFDTRMANAERLDKAVKQRLGA